MAFKQFTKCIQAQDHNTTDRRVQAFVAAAVTTALVSIYPIIVAATSDGSWWCLLLLAPFFVSYGLAAYCDWWLNRRLICLPAPPDHPEVFGGSHIAIGTLIDILKPQDNSFPDIDTDYSIGILLDPNPLGATADVVSASEPFGYLVAEQDVIRNHGVPWSGHPGVDHRFPGHPELEITSEILHCEFEGAGVRDFGQAAALAWMEALAALVACVSFPGIGEIIAAILFALWLITMILGLGIAVLDTGQPSDENPSIGELHTNDENHQGADALLIIGHWVYDSGHNDDGRGFNEIHPVTFATKWRKDFGGDVILLKKRWAGAVADARSEATLESQTLPQNQWQVHPMLDGCQPVIIV